MKTAIYSIFCFFFILISCDKQQNNKIDVENWKGIPKPIKDFDQNRVANFKDYLESNDDLINKGVYNNSQTPHIFGNLKDQIVEILDNSKKWYKKPRLSRKYKRQINNTISRLKSALQESETGGFTQYEIHMKGYEFIVLLYKRVGKKIPDELKKSTIIYFENNLSKSTSKSIVALLTINNQEIDEIRIKVQGPFMHSYGKVEHQSCGRGGGGGGKQWKSVAVAELLGNLENGFNVNKRTQTFKCKDLVNLNKYKAIYNQLNGLTLVNKEILGRNKIRKNYIDFLKPNKLFFKKHKIAIESFLKTL
jgi:hypothetical protein